MSNIDWPGTGHEAHQQYIIDWAVTRTQEIVRLNFSSTHQINEKKESLCGLPCLLSSSWPLPLVSI